LYKKDSSIINL